MCDPQRALGVPIRATLEGDNRIPCQDRNEPMTVDNRNGPLGGHGAHQMRKRYADGAPMNRLTAGNLVKPAYHTKPLGSVRTGSRRLSHVEENHDLNTHQDKFGRLPIRRCCHHQGLGVISEGGGFCRRPLF